MTRLKLRTYDHGSFAADADRWEAWLERLFRERGTWRLDALVRKARARTERAARRRVIREYRKILERDMAQLAEIEKEEKNP